jgi:hypothetical protein
MKKTLAVVLSLCLPGCVTSQSFEYDRCVETASKSKSREQSVKDCESVRRESKSATSPGADSFLAALGLGPCSLARRGVRLRSLFCRALMQPPILSVSTSIE